MDQSFTINQPVQEIATGRVGTVGVIAGEPIGSRIGVDWDTDDGTISYYMVDSSALRGL
ncbi:hypothetical protein [Mycolicibacter senuensis]|uniref:hypothetical protein n=1 Tax=Mycolicibacter senuensis TaxID=386913 RepID=UPI00140245E8|nr:hypothetical protein [Mycolicibacter senuensis]